jgi:hypothetical protein
MKDYNISFFQHKLKEWELKNDKEGFNPEFFEDTLESMIEESYEIVTPECHGAEKKEDLKVLRERGIINLLKLIFEVSNHDNINIQELLINHFRNDLKLNI